MKTILCYGDSNTWGSIPLEDLKTNHRYGRDERWTGVMRAALGDEYLVIEEGLGGRTTAFDDPIEGAHKNGRTYLLPCLESHAPLDLVIVMLGTNDLKARFSLGPFDIAAAAGKLLDIITDTKLRQQDAPPKTMLVCPAPLARLSLLADMFDGGGGKSTRLADHYAMVAAERGCAFVDAGTIITSSARDGIHLEADQHLVLGNALADEVRSVFSR